MGRAGWKGTGQKKVDHPAGDLLFLAITRPKGELPSPVLPLERSNRCPPGFPRTRQSIWKEGLTQFCSALDQFCKNAAVCRGKICHRNPLPVHGLAIGLNPIVDQQASVAPAAPAPTHHGQEGPHEPEHGREDEHACEEGEPIHGDRVFRWVRYSVFAYRVPQS